MALQAIQTTYLQPTDTRGARMSAKCDAMCIVVSYDHALNLEENHKAACDELCRRMDERCAKAYGSAPRWNRRKVSGELVNRSHVHVFVEE